MGEGIGSFFQSSAGKAILSGAVGTAGSATSTAIGNSRKARLAEYAHQQDINQWNRQNAYNHPAMQMERLKNAGLNPNLVYGSGSVTGNVSGQLPKYSAPGHQKVETPTGTDVLGMYSKQEMLPLQKNQAEATIENTLQEAENKRVNAVYLKHKAEKEGINAEYQREMNENSLQSQQEDIRLKQNRIKGVKLSNKHQKELNRLLIDEGINPNDAAWYRDLKKGGLEKVFQWMINNSYLKGTQINPTFKN